MLGQGPLVSKSAKAGAVCTLQTLYESSIAFGMRKALQTEAGKSDMEQRINTLEAEAKDLERQVGCSKSHGEGSILFLWTGECSCRQPGASA